MEYRASKMVKKLVNRIKEEFGIECDPNSFRRTYAGWWQKSDGAYSWTLKMVDEAGGYIAGHVAGFSAASEYIKKKNNIEGYHEGFDFVISIVPEIKTIPYNPTKYKVIDEQNAESVKYHLGKGESLVIDENYYIYRCVEKRKYGTTKLLVAKGIPIDTSHLDCHEA